MLVEQLVQRQSKQDLVDDRDRMLESAVFGDEVITEDKSLSSPHEFMGSRSKQWSQRYKGLLMDFEGAERHIAQLKAENAELKARVNKARDIIAKATEEF